MTSLDTAFYESLRQKHGEFLPPVDCTEWCGTKDGHPHEYHVEDQSCWSDGDYTDLSRCTLRGKAAATRTCRSGLA